MQRLISKRTALTLVKQYCKALDLQMAEEEKEHIAQYLRLQERNRQNNQTTLIEEDNDVIQALSSMAARKNQKNLFI
ncbi:hypothetical protein HYU12_02930 [Candidatus Woesearchaeota archaeon]|nr:hypothetical protein [Candidatus Woesearchaeota archaeon]